MVNQKKLDISNITDNDILNMPEKDYMNPLQLAYFRNKLIENEKEILANAKKTTQDLQKQETTYIADQSDRATLEEEYALELRTRDRERKLLQKIHKAIELIDAGSYGYCEDSGEPIGLKRLLARPTATFSIDAQERREKLQKHFAED